MRRIVALARLSCSWNERIDQPKDDRLLGEAEADERARVCGHAFMYRKYGSGGSYAVLAGKGRSRPWTVKHLKPQDKDCKTFDDWQTVFTCVPSPTLSLFYVGYRSLAVGLLHEMAIHCRLRCSLAAAVANN